MSRDPRLFLQDILDSVAKVASYTCGMTQEAFEGNRMAYDAVIRNLELIGEAAKQGPPRLEGIRANHPLAHDLRLQGSSRPRVLRPGQRHRLGGGDSKAPSAPWGSPDS